MEGSNPAIVEVYPLTSTTGHVFPSNLSISRIILSVSKAARSTSLTELVSPVG